LKNQTICMIFQGKENGDDNKKEQGEKVDN
jgi:hypothetical protein